jgi:hypothetical protein
MSQQFCLVIYRDVPDGDEEYTVEKPTEVEFLEEPNYAEALTQAYETIRQAPGGDLPTRAVLITASDITHIKAEDEETVSEMDKLQMRVNELEVEAEGFHEVMDAITEFSGTDPRKVAPMNPFPQCTQPPLHDIAINLMNEAVRKRAQEMTK